MIKLSITRTSKAYNKPSGEYTTYDTETKEFDTIKQAKEYVADQYFYCKTKRPIYQDGKNGEAVKVGYIYCYKNDGDKRYEEPGYLCQDWVTYQKVTYSTITI